MGEQRRLDRTDEKPTISRETLNSAAQNLVHQYDNHGHGEILPEAVYIKHLPSYDEFFSNFLLRNQLCILSEEATKTWRSRREWVQQDRRPNIDFFLQEFGDATVPVADCKKKEFSAHVKQEMKMWEFLTYWKQLQDAGENGDVHSDSLYLKDWHFTRAFPDYEAYSTVGFFRSDWMNEFWDVREDIDDDYRFVYMGPKGTWTPFHADVFRSFSWSANICGRKKWIFYPPGEEEFLKNKHGSLVYDVTSDELRDPRKFPNAHKAKHRIELVQNPGETIFVPSGWHHQVHNLDDTISINHNWLNGCNVRLCWAHLKDALKAVEKEISDCRDMDGWEQQCQLILKADTGLDFIEFFRFMETVAERRQLALNQWKQSSSDSQRCNRENKTPRGGDLASNSDSEVKGRCQREAGSVVISCSEVASALSEHDQAIPGSLPRDERTSRAGVCQCVVPDTAKCRRDEQCGDSTGKCETNNSVDTSSCKQTTEDNSKSGAGCRTEPSQKTSSTDSSTTNPCACLHCGSTASTNSASQDRNDLLNLFQLSPPGKAMKEPHWAVCSVNHALFDLVSVALVVRDMIRTTDIVTLLSPDRTQTPTALLQSLSKTFSDFGVSEKFVSFEV